jgi:SOS-response transcriptional repressor LexA
MVTASAYVPSMDDKWFKKQQKIAGVTAEDIAARMGRDRSVVSRIYVGRQSMTLEQAIVFSEVLGRPLSEVLERAGVADATMAQQIAPGFAESDAVAWQPKGSGERAVPTIAEAMGARPGVDIWRVQSGAMALQGILPGDWMLVDSHAAERVRAGDVVIAQVYDNARGVAATVLRRFEPPVLVAASPDPADFRVHVVDGSNVVLRGKVVASWRV